MKCPRCLIELIELGVAQGRALGCEQCGGLWLDQVATIDLMENRTASLASRAPVARPEHDESKTLVCPVCRVPLNKEELYYVQVDRCAAHGVWFDRGELEFAAREHAAAHSEAALSPGERFARNASRWNQVIDSVVERASRDLQDPYTNDDDDY